MADDKDILARLDALAVEMRELRGETASGFRNVSTDIRNVAADIRELRLEMRERFADVGDELRTLIRRIARVEAGGER